MSPTERAVAWEKKRVFFLTPQVFTNDLTCGACAAASIKCLVVDEAHRALGNHSYCQVGMSVGMYCQSFQVLICSHHTHCNKWHQPNYSCLFLMLLAAPYTSGKNPKAFIQHHLLFLSVYMNHITMHYE
jgi:hypothetical protein